MKKNALGLLLAALAALCALLTAPGSASAEGRDYDCSDFPPSAGPSWPMAQHFYLAHDPARDPYDLDHDRDGYACEKNAEKTPVGWLSVRDAMNDDKPIGAEPKCYSSDSCFNRNLYRRVFWLTRQTDMTAVRGAMLVVYAPGTKNSKDAGLYGYFENAFEFAGNAQKAGGATSVANARCQRFVMLQYLKMQNKVENAYKIASSIFDAGSVEAKKTYAFTTAYVRFTADVVLEVGSDVAYDWARIAVDRNAVAYLGNSVSCDGTDQFH